MMEQIDTSHLTDVYVEGLLCVQNLGTNFRAVYYVPAKRPDGLGYYRVPVLSIIRPKSSLLDGRLTRMLAMEPVALVEPAMRLHA